MVVVERKEDGSIHDRASYTLSKQGRNFYADCEELGMGREIIFCQGKYYVHFSTLDDGVKIRDNAYIEELWRDPK